MARDYYGNTTSAGAFFQKTAFNAASGIGAANIPSGSRLAVISVEGANVRWRDDGVAPTTAIGNRILKDTTTVYSGDLATIQFIDEAGAGAAKLNISFYR